MLSIAVLPYVPLSAGTIVGCQALRRESEWMERQTKPAKRARDVRVDDERGERPFSPGLLSRVICAKTRAAKLARRDGRATVWVFEGTEGLVAVELLESRKRGARRPRVNCTCSLYADDFTQRGDTCPGSVHTPGRSRTMSGRQVPGTHSRAAMESRISAEI